MDLLFNKCKNINGYDKNLKIYVPNTDKTECDNICKHQPHCIETLSFQNQCIVTIPFDINMVTDLSFVDQLFVLYDLYKKSHNITDNIDGVMNAYLNKLKNGERLSPPDPIAKIMYQMTCGIIDYVKYITPNANSIPKCYTNRNYVEQIKFASWFTPKIK